MCDCFFFFLVKRAGRHFVFFKRAGRHETGAGRRALKKKPRQNTVLSHTVYTQKTTSMLKGDFYRHKKIHIQYLDCNGFLR